jgi:tetratricopeptide (TPR) repeat protein
MLHAEALAVRGRSLLEAGQLSAARADLERAHASFQALGVEARRKEALVDLSILARHQGDLGEAWALIQEAQALHAGGNRWLEAYAVGNLGLVEQARRGAVAALPHLRAAVELFRAVGDATFEAIFLINCGLALGEAGAAEAEPFLDEGMSRALSAGFQVGHVTARLNLGCLLLGADHAADAYEHLETVDRMARQLGLRLLEGTARGELGRASLALGAGEAARRQLGEALGILGPVSRSNALRFTAYLCATHALEGRLEAARAGFAELEAAPEPRDDAALGALVALLRAAMDVAELRAAPPGGEEARRAERAFHQRLEAARAAPAAAASSDLRASLRLLERWSQFRA